MYIDIYIYFLYLICIKFKAMAHLAREYSLNDLNKLLMKNINI